MDFAVDPKTYAGPEMVFITAAELDRLRAEVARLTAERDKLLKVCEDKERHMDGWRKAADEDRAEIRRLAADLAAERGRADGLAEEADVLAGALRHYYQSEKRYPACEAGCSCDACVAFDLADAALAAHAAARGGEGEKEA